MGEANDISDMHRHKRRWRQFSLRTLLLVTVCLAVLIAASVAIWREHADPRRHIRRLQYAISGADRIVVRTGNDSDNRSLDELSILFEVTDKAEVVEARQHLQFLTQTSSPPYLCGVPPEIDWYCGDKWLVRMWLRQDGALEWTGAHDIAMLEPESLQWIVHWLAENGIPLAVTRTPLDSQEGARRELHSRMPVGFWEAVLKAEAETAAQLRGGELPTPESVENLKDRYVGQLCKDRDLLYRALFRMMDGSFALSNTWECRETVEAFQFLTRAARDELDRAFRSAAASANRLERRGAAHVVFAQHFMPLYGKSDDDLVRWMDALLETAYSNPDYANRRLVLSRLVEYPQVQANSVLVQAVEDPDSQVRRLAIEGLRLRGGADAVALLRRVAAGQSKPRKAVFSIGLPHGETASEDAQDAESDAGAAAKALQAMAR